MPGLDIASLIEPALPLWSADRERHLALLDADDLSTAALVQSMARDPVAVHHVVRAAMVRAAQARRPQTPQSLEQCLQILGKSQLESLLRGLPVYERLEARHAPHRQLLGQSVYAAELARRWAIDQGQRQVDAVWLGALLYNQLLWLLSFHHAEDFAQLGLLLNSRRQVASLEHEHYGAPLNQLARQLHARITPLELLLSACEPGMQPSARDYLAMVHGDMNTIRQHSSRAGSWILHANDLAAAIVHQGPWMGSRLRLFAALFRRSGEQLWIQARDQLLHLAEQTEFGPGLAGSLLWSSAPAAQRRLSLPYWCPRLAPAVSAAAPSAAQKLTQLQTELAQQTHLNGLLQTLMRLWLNAGCTRLALLIFSADRQKLRTLVSHGWPPDAPLPPLKLQVHDYPLLASLASKTSLLVLDHDTQARYEPHLPEALRQSLQRPALIGSLNNGEQALAILIADAQGSELGDSTRKAVRQSLQTAQQIIAALRAARAQAQE